jgi:hypothetical protein
VLSFAVIGLFKIAFPNAAVRPTNIVMYKGEEMSLQKITFGARHLLSE